MGRVKDFYHEEICARANDEPWGPEPDDLEMLEIDYERARQRLEDYRNKQEQRHERAR